MPRNPPIDRTTLGAVRLDTGRTADEELKSLKALAKLLDSRFELMGIRFGADALIGLIPVVGDAVTLAAGTAALSTSMRLRLPWHVHARITANLVADAGIGAIPVLGDAFDFFFQSHKRNFDLIERHVLKRAAAQLRKSG